MESIQFQLSSFYLREGGIEELREVLEPLVQKAYEDPEFKKEFIADPLGVVQRETGDEYDFPGSGELVVLDKTNPFSLYLTLPVNEDMLELSDEELELVAGGVGDIKNGNCFLCGNKNCKSSCGGGGEEEE